MGDGENNGLRNRRNFLKALVGGGALAAVGIETPRVALAQQKGANCTDVLAQTTFTDQYGETFNPKQILKGKPYILVEGFLHCLGACPKIRDNLSIIRERLESEATKLENAGEKEQASALRNIPIVWVDTLPEKYGANPGDKKEPKACVVEAYKRGFWQNKGDAKDFPQSPAERQKLAEKSYDKKPAQKERLLHIAFPPSNAAAVALQQQLKIPFNSGDFKSHGGRIALIGADETIKAVHLGTIPATNQHAHQELLNTIIGAALTEAGVQQGVRK